jgi:hypothetical protein
MPGSQCLNKPQKVGTEVYVKFSGDDFFYTRVLLRHVSRKVYFTLDSQFNVSREDLGSKGITVRGRSATGGIPPDIADDVYDFDDFPTQEEFEGFVNDANAMDDSEDQARDGSDIEDRAKDGTIKDGHSEKRVTFTVPDDLASPTTRPSILRAPPKGRGLQVAQSDAAPSQHDGARVPRSHILGGPSQSQSQGIVRNGVGAVGAEQHGGTASMSGGLGALSAALGKDFGSAHMIDSAHAEQDVDVRVLPVRYDRNSNRFREFRDSNDLCCEHDFSDWPVPGPKTVEWCLKFMINRGGTPLGWHELWRSNGRLQDSEHLVMQHLSLCEILEASATYDQLNVPALASMEFVCRQIQICEDKLSHRFEDTSADAVSQDYFLMSGSRSKQQLCVCPALMAFTSSETAKKSAILKERRKAREERVLAHPKKNAKKGGANEPG